MLKLCTENWQHSTREGLLAFILRSQSASSSRELWPSRLAGGERGELALGALAVGGGGNLGGAAVALGHTLVFLADLLGGSARAADGSHIAIVGVDADKVGSYAVGLDVLDDNVAGAAVASAVAAATVKLAGVDDGEAIDGNSAAAVVLDDLVLGVLCTSTLDEDVAAAEGRDGVLKRVLARAISG